MHALSSLFGHQARFIVLATALGFMALEYGLSRLARHDAHDLRESAASLVIAIGQHLIRVAEAIFLALPFAFVYQHRLLDIKLTGIPTLLSLFLATEFFYYWQHRASHRIRWFWATHSVHHSPTKLNFTAAIRLGWTGNLSGNFLFLLPLVWIGFNPVAIISTLGLNLFYQFFIHTELAPRLGPLEWIFNTPAHHRVHHASNAACLDRNYGGVLILFDRLFGTFAAAPEHEPLRYGLVGDTPSFNPVRIAFGEWSSMLRDLRRARGSARLSALFGPPETGRAVAGRVEP
jgi:sterol desaturase/sphingolipid hydroxylase (fatty acid hydroxylase superfamily)